MEKRHYIILSLTLLLCASGAAQSSRGVEREFRRAVGTLAGEAMGGRAAESRGDTLAVAYLRDFLDGLRGVEMLFDDGVQAFTAEGWNGEVRSFNVAGLIEGRDPALKNEVILLGAHYDHMGVEAGGFGEIPELKLGADDNASGTAMVMALARRIARRTLDRSVMVVFFGAEERGLVGSRYLAEHMPALVPPERVAAMVNFDMVGRLTPERGLNLYGDSLYAPAWPFAELAPLNLHADLSAASDHVPFAERGVPAWLLITGLHADYHRAGDTAERINYTGMALVYRYALTFIRALGSAPELQ